jgi:hypothetical protein
MTSSFDLSGLQLECRKTSIYFSVCLLSRHCQEIFSQRCQLLVYLSSLLPEVESIIWNGKRRILNFCCRYWLIWLCTDSAAPEYNADTDHSLTEQSDVEPIYWWLETLFAALVQFNESGQSCQSLVEIGGRGGRASEASPRAQSGVVLGYVSEGGDSPTGCGGPRAQSTEKNS